MRERQMAFDVLVRFDVLLLPLVHRQLDAALGVQSRKSVMTHSALYIDQYRTLEQREVFSCHT
jgi:hypothetical protein